MAESSYIHLCFVGLLGIFFFSITLSSKCFVLCRRLVTAFYAIEHLVRREFYLRVRNVSCHVKYKVLYRSDSLRDTHCWCLIICQNLTVEIGFGC